MKFWKGKMGHPKIGGHISPNDDSNPNFLFEFYSSEPQPDHLPYPMEVRDLSVLYNHRVGSLWGENWEWYKETREHIGANSRVMMWDIFRLRQENVQS